MHRIRKKNMLQMDTVGKRFLIDYGNKVRNTILPVLLFKRIKDQTTVFY